MRAKKTHTLTQDGLACTLQNALDANLLNREYKSKVSEIRKSHALPGFRAGKVPAKLIENRYGEGIRSEIISELIEKDLQSIFETEALDPIAAPKVDLDQQADQVAYTATFECYPPVDVDQIKSFEVVDWEVVFDQDDQDALKQELMQKHADWKEEGQGKKVKKGHKLVIDFAGTVDGQAFEGGSSQDYEAEIGKGHFLPAFEKAILSAKVGDELKSVSVVFPDDYQKDDLRGREASFDISVKSAKKSVPLKDEAALFEKIGGEAKDWDMYLESIKEDMANQSSMLLDSVRGAEVVKAILNQLVVECPSSLIDEYMQSAKKTGDDKKDKEDAEKHVKLSVVLRKLAQKTKATVSEQEVDQHIFTMLPMLKDNKQLLDWYKSDQQRLQKVRNTLLENKLLQAAHNMCVKKDKSTLNHAKAKAFIDQEL